MPGEQLINDSWTKTVDGRGETSLESASNHGLRWHWRFYTDFAITGAGKHLEKCVFESWWFEWNEEELKKHGFEGYEGEMIAWYEKEIHGVKTQVPVHFDVKLTESGQMVRKLVGTVEETRKRSDSDERILKFTFKFRKIPKIEQKEVVGCVNCQQSCSRTILVVDGVKIAVDKHLSLRSEYFNTLFNSDFKEKSMPEIPIEDVRFADFQRLLALIDLKSPTSVTDSDAEMLLKLADRFMIPAVTIQVENHLVSASELPFVQLLKLASEFELEKLQEYCLKRLISMDHIKFVSQTPELEGLSMSLKNKMLDKFAEVVRISSG